MKTAILTTIVALVALALAACGGGLLTAQEAQRKSNDLLDRHAAIAHDYAEVRQYVPAVESYLASAGKAQQARALRAADDFASSALNAAGAALAKLDTLALAYDAASAALDLATTALRDLEDIVNPLKEAAHAASDLATPDVAGPVERAPPARTAEGKAEVEQAPVAEPQATEPAKP